MGMEGGGGGGTLLKVAEATTSETHGATVIIKGGCRTASWTEVGQWNNHLLFAIVTSCTCIRVTI